MHFVRMPTRHGAISLRYDDNSR
uniref:Uncharacterized protein n=1 Tax=Arundo donax TaxID=35708 RepID=A0A0A9F4R6_ARUDO